MEAIWYNVRITPNPGAEEVCKERLSKFVGKHVEGYVVAEEYGKRQGGFHYQCWMTSFENRKNFGQNMRNALGDSIPKGSGSGINENDIRDPEALQRYVCKGAARGTLPVIAMMQVFNWDHKEYVLKYHTDYWDEHDRLVSSVKEKKLGLYEELLAFANGGTEGCNTREEIARKYVQICIDIGKPIDVFRARPVVNMVWAKTNPNAAEWITQEILAKI